MSLSPRPEMFTITMSDGSFGSALDAFRDRVRRLERRDNSFQPSKLAGLQRLLVAGRNILRPPLIVQQGVFGPDRRIIQSRGNRMGRRNLAR